MAKRTVAAAPARLGGDSIDLGALEGKMVAILCVERDEKKTKFGERSMTHVAVVAHGSKDVLEGIMFQSYFQTLELDKWFIGVVKRVEAGNNRAWVLATEGMDAKMAKDFAKTLDSVKLRAEAAAEML